MNLVKVGILSALGAIVARKLGFPAYYGGAAGGYVGGKVMGAVVGGVGSAVLLPENSSTGTGNLY